MTLRSLFFSAAILVSTATAAAAAPNHRNDDRRDFRDGQRDHRVQRSWNTLATLQVTSNRTMFKLDRRAAAVDDLRIEASRGTVNVRQAVIVFTDGTRYVAKVGKRLAAGQSQVIAIPGAAKRIASVELRYANVNTKQARSRAQILVSAR